MSLYDAVRDLPLIVDGYALDGPRAAGLERVPAQDDGDPARTEPARRGSARTSPTTATEHDLAAGAGPDATRSPASGRSHTFSEHLATLPLFDHEPEQHAYLDYRRWAFESAALDLALRQAGRVARRRGRPRGRGR